MGSHKLSGWRWWGRHVPSHFPSLWPQLRKKGQSLRNHSFAELQILRIASVSITCGNLPVERGRAMMMLTSPVGQDYAGLTWHFLDIVWVSTGSFSVALPGWLAVREDPKSLLHMSVPPWGGLEVGSGSTVTTVDMVSPAHPDTVRRRHQ